MREVMFASYGGLKIVVRLLRTGVRPLQVASFGSSRPNVGAGPGVRGITLCSVNFRNSARDEDLKGLGELQLCLRPLTPNPSPTLGRGEAIYRVVREPEEFRLCNPH